MKILKIIEYILLVFIGFCMLVALIGKMIDQRLEQQGIAPKKALPGIVKELNTFYWKKNMILPESTYVAIAEDSLTMHVFLYRDVFKGFEYRGVFKK